MARFPFFEIVNYETGLPVNVAVWHVRSVRPIREMADDNETITRIEFTNGDVLDSSDSVPEVLRRAQEALGTLTGYLDSVAAFAFQRSDR